MAGRLIYLYILFLPLMHLPKPAFMASKIQYCDLIFVPLFFIFISEVFKKHYGFIKNRVSVLLALLITLSFISFLHSALKQEIFLDFLGLIYLVSLFFSLTFLINNKQEFIRINLFLFIVAIIICIIGILISIFYNIFHIEALNSFLYTRATDLQSSIIPFSRASSLLTLPEMFINFILLGLSSAFAYRSCLMEKEVKKRRIADFFISLIILSAFLAFSRSLVGLMLFLTMATFYFSRKGLVKAALRIFCALLFLLLFLSSISIWIFTVYPVSFSIDKITRIANLSFNANFDTRFYLAKAALAIGNKYPFLGMGPGTFTNHFREFLNKNDLAALSMIRKEPVSLLKIDPHSLYFGAIAELGYVGAAVLFMALFFILREIIKAHLNNADNYIRNFSYIYLAAISAFLLNGFFVDILSMRSFWVLLSFGFITAKLNKSKTIT